MIRLFPHQPHQDAEHNPCLDVSCIEGDAMPYTVAEAAKAIGKSKPTILRAIRRGQISATRDDAGAFRIDAAELHRVFPLPDTDADRDPDDNATRRDDLRQRLAVAEARLTETQDAVRTRDDTIIDLRRRLDTATEQLGEALQQVRLLTDQRTPSAAPARRSWLPWRRP
jgi:excisionase family DNA binding protein